MGIGIAWALLGGFFLGTFALPSKYIKNYEWENTWGAFFFFAMLVVPVGFAACVVNGLWSTFGDVSPMAIFGVMALSFLWGCGFCCWGYGLSMVGLSLGYAMTMGTMCLVGSMLPFFMGNASDAGTTGGLIVILGILVCITGVAINGFAGVKRDKSQGGGEAEEGSGKKKSMLAGLMVCVLAGVLSSGLNIAFHIGGQAEWVGGEVEIAAYKAEQIAEVTKSADIPVLDKAKKIAEIGKAKIQGIGTISKIKYKNVSWQAGLSTWTLVFLGGFLSSVGFAVYKLCKNKTWGNFKNVGSSKNLIFALIMGAGHFLCVFFYGLGATAMGELGTSVAFAIFQASSVVLGISLGFLTGEWKGADAKSKRLMFVGLSVLILGIVVVSYGKYAITTQ
jgi:L-rhamnose-H+ transport protein